MDIPIRLIRKPGKYKNLIREKRITSKLADIEKKLIHLATKETPEEYSHFFARLNTKWKELCSKLNSNYIYADPTYLERCYKPE